MSERLMKGRRIPVPESGDFNEVIPLMGPGDYCGPMKGYTGDKPCVFFMKPNAWDENIPCHRSRRVQHVVSPPHTFRECSDGSLEIRASISDHAGTGSESDGWHGFLDEGHIWRQV